MKNRFTMKDSDGRHYIESANGKLESNIFGHTYGEAIDHFAKLETADVVERNKLKQLIERKYGDLDNTCGCYVNGQWLSVAAIVELIDQTTKE